MVSERTLSASEYDEFSQLGTVADYFQFLSLSNAHLDREEQEEEEWGKDVPYPTCRSRGSVTVGS